MKCLIKGCDGPVNHTFPIRRPVIFQQWLSAVGKKAEDIKNSHGLCSRHFKPEDYTHQEIDVPFVRAQRLHKTAVPSINLVIPDGLPKQSSQVGPGNLEVKVNCGRIPTSAQAQGPHTYAISFTPRESMAHTVDLCFNGEDVPGSPFTCQVNDVAKVLVSKALEKVSVNREVSFAIEADSKPTVDVLAPMRESLPVSITSTGPCSYTAGFTPKDVGNHNVQVKLKSVHVEGSPFLVKAYNANQVKVTDINSGIVGKAVFFSINASQAGAGNLKVIVAVNGKNVPYFVQSECNAKFQVNFKPQEAALHSLSVHFNGEPVPGSPFTCQVFGIGSTQISGHNLKMAVVKQPVAFVVDPQVVSKKCDVAVTPPSSNVALPITIKLTQDQRYKVTLTPVEVGRHNDDILVDSEPIKGSPFTCNVYDVTKVHVFGLKKALLGHATTFTVDAAQAGEGTLELVVSTENNTVEAEVVACARGLYDVTFVPQISNTHYVNISFNHDKVPGSPFKCQIVDSILDGPTTVSVGSIADLDNAGITGPLTAEVTESHMPLYLILNRIDEKKKIRVLSLFDGISSGLVVLKTLNIDIEVYYASEISPEAIDISKYNHGTQVEQLGDVKLISPHKLTEIGPIDLLIGGSPCEELSKVNWRKKGLKDKSGTGYLFYYFARIKNYLEKKASGERKFYWFFENVELQLEEQKEVNRVLRTEFKKVGSSDFSPQKRVRLYWTNIPWKPLLPKPMILQECLDKNLNRVAKYETIRTITGNTISLKQVIESQII